MSHFTVLVKVKPEFFDRHGQNPQSAVTEMMIPYQQHQCTGECPEQYLEFIDVVAQEKYDEEYETGSMKMVIMPDGRKLLPWDDEFRIKGQFGFGSSTHKVPDHLEQREIPFKEIYSTFEQFMADWTGHKSKDDKTGKYGYWENPNYKWDWWVIGGRWKNILMAKHGDVNFARIRDLDFERMEAEVDVKIDAFWREIETLIEEGAVDPSAMVHTPPAGSTTISMWGVTDTLFEIGIWGRESLNAPIKQIPFTKELLKSDTYRWRWQFSTFSVLDAEGWHQKGEMLMFGCSTDTIEDQTKWAREYIDRFLKNEDPMTTVVVVDCHV